MRYLLCAAALCLAMIAAVVVADTLILTDGTQLEGRVIPQSDKYWIRLPTGETRLIPASEVKQWIREATATAGAVATTAGASADFNQTRSRAERVDAPLAAVGLWQAFIEANPESPDLEAARTELARWKQLDDDQAEKINGKWVGGEERRRIIERVNRLLKEADSMREAQTIQAIAKLEEAARIYPNSFRANFELGYFLLLKSRAGGPQRIDQAIRALEQATRLRPDSAAAWSNLAIGYNFRQRFEQSVMAAHKAAQIEDSKPVVQNLINAISQAPAGMRTHNSKVRAILDEALVLAGKYGIESGNRPWYYIHPRDMEDAPEEVEDGGRPGVIGNGSGFLVSADGYILTNKHVAEVENCLFMCRFVDGSEKIARVVAIDDEYDIALLKIQPEKDQSFPYLQLAGQNLPSPGADCAALGYPVAHLMNYTMQVTAGTISSVNANDEYPVTLTAKATRGNSGGPLVDKYGNVIGIVSAGLIAYTESYGKAISVEQIRKFLDKNKDTYTATFEPAASSDQALDTEEIYKKTSPAVLCVIMIRAGAGGN